MRIISVKCLISHLMYERFAPFGQTVINFEARLEHLNSLRFYCKRAVPYGAALYWCCALYKNRSVSLQLEAISNLGRNAVRPQSRRRRLQIRKESMKRAEQEERDREVEVQGCTKLYLEK